MENIRTKHDSIVLINREIRTMVQNIGKLKSEAEYQGKRDTEAYQLLNEYHKKMMDMHYDLLHLDY